MEREDNGQDTSLIPHFPLFPFVADLVDGQRRARPQFEDRWPTLPYFGLASERENGRRRRRNRHRKEIKGKLDNRLVSEVVFKS